MLKLIMMMIQGGSTRSGDGSQKRRCGKKDRISRDCASDLSKVRGFRRNDIGRNCPKKGASSSSGSATSSGTAVAKSSPKQGGPKGKGKGKGKKGKLREIAEGEEYWEKSWEENEPQDGVVMMPLMLSAVEAPEEEWCWWLPDSGAAVSVLAERNRKYCKCSGEHEVLDSFFAADGSPVSMSSQVNSPLRLRFRKVARSAVSPLVALLEMFPAT